MTFKATKIVIITEKVILEGVTRIIEDCGATGYTVTPAGGKGSRGMRSTDRPAVVDAFANVKLEVITTDPDVAERIANQVAETYFTNYAGITYVVPVEILRPHKF